MVVGCSTNQRPTSSSMNEEEFQVYDSTMHEERMIAIKASFEPTLELTDKIRNSTLEELIKERYKEYKKRLQVEGSTMSYETLNFIYPNPHIVTAARSHGMREVKKVPMSSNLAKVYFLEDFESFYIDNQEYYESIINIQEEEFDNARRKKLKEKWDKYQ